MERKYTELEIELYEKLTKISLNFKKFSEVFYDSLLHSKDYKGIKNTLIKFIELEGLIRHIKIPKKFLILNKLEEKDKNGNKI